MMIIQYKNSIKVILVKLNIDFNGDTKMIILMTAITKILIFSFELLNSLLLITGFLIFLQE